MKLKLLLTVLLIVVYSGISFSQTITPISLYNNLNEVRPTDKILQDYKFKENITNTIPTAPNSPSTITDNVDVRIFPSAAIQSEVHISINRNNPSNLIASCNTVFPHTGFSDFNQGHYYTTDGGTTWHGDDILQNAGSAIISGDPSTAFNSNNSGFISTMTGAAVCGPNVMPLGYSTQSSANQGLTWTGVTAAANNGCFDKDMIGIDDEVGSPFANNIYGVWIIFMEFGQISHLVI